MKIINLEQRSDEWYIYRNTRIGASEFPILVANKGFCKNIYNKTINQLVKEKLSDERITNNFVMNTGVKFEGVIIENLTMVDPILGEIIQYDKNERIFASLDCRDAFNNMPVEIKATSKKEDKLAEAIEYFKYQVAHQCYVIGADFGMLQIGILSPQRNNLLRIESYKVVAKDVIGKKEWLKICEEFLEILDKNNEAPVEDKYMFETYESVCDELDILEKKKEELRGKLLEKYPNGCNFNEFKINKVTTNRFKPDEYLVSIGVDKKALDKKFYGETISYRITNNKKGE